VVLVQSGAQCRFEPGSCAPSSIPLGVDQWGALLGAGRARNWSAVRSDVHGRPSAWAFLAGCLAALAVAGCRRLPLLRRPGANRSQDFQPGPGLNFRLLPPGQRKPHRVGCACCASENDPKAAPGDPVKISGFVLPVCRVIAPKLRAGLGALLHWSIGAGGPARALACWIQPTPEADLVVGDEG